MRPSCILGIFAVTWLAAGETLAQGPIPESISKSGLGGELSDFATIPASSGSAPLARINLLLHAGDGSGRVFVNDMRGSCWVIESDGTLLATPFLDTSTAPGVSLDASSNQLGFTSFAFHPDYAEAGTAGRRRFYTATHESTSSGMPDFLAPTEASFHNVIAEWQVDPFDPNRIDPSSRRELLRIEGYSGDHPLGLIGFDPTLAPDHPDYGLLYVAMGDGGDYIASSGEEIDPYRTAQDLSNPYGALLRIDPLGTSDPTRPTNGEYGIPDDNPFVTNPGAVQEIWAYGLRNPHRFGWDAPSGKMWISDIGQAHVEEINLGVAGANYGWSERQGTWVLDHDDQTVFPALPENDSQFGYRYPVAQYDHDEGRAIVGAGVYRGSANPALVGELVFGDLWNGRLFHTGVDALEDGVQSPIRELTLLSGGNEVTLLELLGGAPRADLRFGFDEAGELYLLSKRDGSVRSLPEPSRSSAIVAGGLLLASLLRRRARPRVG